MSKIYIADKSTLDKVRDNTDFIIANMMTMNNNATLKTQVAANYFNTKKNGKVFSVFFNDFNNSPTPTGTRKNDAVGMIARPSTDSIAARNDFDDYAIFNGLTVNGHVDADGEFIVDYFEGEDGFDKFTQDVYVLFGTSYVKIDIDATGETISVSDTKRDGYFPMGGAVRTDKTIRPFIPIAKYYASEGASGTPMSVSGAAAYHHMSHNVAMNTFRTKGNQYCATTIQDTFLLETLFQVVFATRNSQSIMAGCTSYNNQVAITKAETGVHRALIASGQSAKYLVGSVASIGHKTNDSADRNNASMHNVADRRVVTKVEEVTVDGTTYTAVYLDGSAFDTDTTCIISNMPWRTGATDDVLGTCGSPLSNTDGKTPCRFFGVEMFIGQYEVLGNAKYRQSNASGSMIGHYDVCYDCTNLSNSATDSHYVTVDGYDMPGGASTWKYPSEMGFDSDNPCVRGASALDADSSKGYCDGNYMNNSNGTYEVLAFGRLSYGANAGLFARGLHFALSDTSWSISARLSATGRCGVVTAA